VRNPLGMEVAAEDRRDRDRDRRNSARRADERIARERAIRLARLDDPVAIALWELEMETADLARDTYVRTLRERLGLK
jgi:hypothetical protein